jgi:hypothetical protein
MDLFKYDHRNGMLIPNDEHIIIFFKRVAQPPNTLMASCRGAIGQLLGCRMETNQLEISSSITKISSLFKSTNQNKSKQIKIEKMSEV